MSSFFVFNVSIDKYNNNSWNPAQSLYYAHLVTSLPQVYDDSIDDLPLPNETGYSHKYLTNVTYQSGTLSFDPVTFNKYNGDTPVIGAVICATNSSTPQPNDFPVVFSRFFNAANQPVSVLASDIENIRIAFPNGAIKFNNMYAYTSGSNLLDDGIFWLLGTNNGQSSYNPNSVISYGNPSSSKVNIITGGLVGGHPVYIPTLLVNKSTTDDSPAYFNFSRTLVFDFKNRKIKVGGISFNAVGVPVPNTSINVDGSNYLPSFDMGSADNDNNWTNITTIPSQDYNVGSIYSFSISSSQYFRYIRIQVPNTLDFGFNEFDFTNSIILSPDENLISS